MVPPLGYKRNYAKQAMESKPENSVAPWFLPLFLMSSCPDWPQWSAMIATCKPNKHFLPQVAFGHGVYCSQRNQTRTPSSCFSPPVPGFFVCAITFNCYLFVVHLPLPLFRASRQSCHVKFLCPSHFQSSYLPSLTYRFLNLEKKDLNSS